MPTLLKDEAAETLRALADGAGIEVDIPRVSVVIPAKNEAENLRIVLPQIPRWIHEVVLVVCDLDDPSVAATREFIPQAVVICQDRPGKGAALRCGFAACTGDIIVTLDADGSADPGEIPAFVGALVAGADFVKGSRFSQGGKTDDMEWYRAVGNWGLLKLANIGFGGRYTDLCYGYNAFWRDVLPYFDLETVDGFEIETSMLLQALQAGLRISEIPSHELPRIHGKSNLQTIPDGWRVLKTIIKLRLNGPRKRRPQPPAQVSLGAARVARRGAPSS